MQDKHLVLIPVNDETRAAIGTERVPVERLPFRVGRESRFRMVEGQLVSMERRNPTGQANNDLYVLDQEKFLNVSREHFQIERLENGDYAVVDVGSTCGTIVDAHAIGTTTGQMRVTVHQGSLIRLGTPASPFQFRVELNGAASPAS